MVSIGSSIEWDAHTVNAMSLLSWGIEARPLKGLFGRLLGETFECCPFECDLLFFWRTLESRFVLGNRKKERAVLDPSSASLQAAYLQREEAHLGDPSSEEHTGCHMPSVSQISYQ